MIELSHALPLTTTAWFALGKINGDGNNVIGWILTFEGSTTMSHRGILTMIKESNPNTIATFDVVPGVMVGNSYMRVQVNP